MDNFCVDCGKKISKEAKRCKSCATKKSWALGQHINNYSPEANEKRRAAWTPELREMVSEKCKEHHQDHPEVYKWTEETRQKVEDSHTDEWRKRHGELSRQAWTPQRRAAQADRMRNMLQSQRDRIGDITKQHWQDPAKRAAHVANMINAWTEEKRKNQSERMVGENNPTWQGGQSEYDDNFTEEFRVLIRLRDNYTCAICDRPGKDVHHIDYNKENTTSENCITLCKSCHSRTNCNRDYWEQVCKDILKRSM